MATLIRKPSAVLLGLTDDLAGEIAHPLRQFCSTVNDCRFSPTPQADVIFCPADLTLIGELRNAYPGVPIVVVSRRAEVNDWLDSIEAGATDYCAAPFEPTQVKWILESSMAHAAAA